MKGTPDAYGAFSGQLLDPIQFTVKGGRDVAVLRVADVATGQVIFAVLGDDITESLGTAEAPFVKPGDEVGLYGGWKGDWLVIETVGRKGPASAS
jgi:hypothetical protein